MDAGLTLVIPAYNEAAVIRQAIREADAALSEHFDDYEILVVDDGSTDGMPEIMTELLAEYPRLDGIRHEPNRGYGAALRTGFEAARFPLVAFTDADCQFDLAELATLAPLARFVPIVAGYRADRQDPWRRKFLSRGYNRIIRTLLGTRVRDCDCALKVFRREALPAILPQSRGFFANAEMLTRARLAGFGIAEVPVTHRPRAGGASKVSLWEVPKTLRVLLSFWWHTVVWGKTGPVATVVAGRITVESRPGMSPTLAPRLSNAPPRQVARPERRREAA